MASIVKNVVHWGSQHRVPSPAQVELCEICGKKPKFIENGIKHPYCSRRCARNGQGPSPTACILHGCRSTGKPAFANFCSEAHSREGVLQGQVEGCDHCHTLPRMMGNLCMGCDRRARAGPRLRELNPDGSTFKNLRAQFLSEWDSSQGSPSFQKAYETILTRDNRVRHDIYRSKNPTFEEIRTFHGSQCICDLGFKDSSLCEFKSCGICGIIKSSFKSFAFGATSTTGRFGEGIYSYRNPALADQYATSCTSSPYRVMIACDVVAEPGQCSADDISDEESVFVQISDAIIPVYVIMYTK